MTPDEAHRAIHDAEDLRSNIPAYCWRALEFVAGTREEWGVEERHEYTDKWTWHSTHPDRESALSRANGMGHFRVVRRYVTEPEEA